jgi:hypothetical protein
MLGSVHNRIPVIIHNDFRVNAPNEQGWLVIAEGLVLPFKSFSVAIEWIHRELQLHKNLGEFLKKLEIHLHECGGLPDLLLGEVDKQAALRDEVHEFDDGCGACIGWNFDRLQVQHRLFLADELLKLNIVKLISFVSVLFIFVVEVLLQVHATWAHF